MNNKRPWITFIVERFEPFSHLAMIAAFYLSHIVFIQLLSLEEVNIQTLKSVLLGIAVVLFFFKLRLYDEIKDYEYDLKHNPTRPLARGLLNQQNLYHGIIVCIIFELLCFSIAGIQAVIAIAFCHCIFIINVSRIFHPSYYPASINDICSKPHRCKLPAFTSNFYCPYRLFSF